MSKLHPTEQRPTAVLEQQALQAIRSGQLQVAQQLYRQAISQGGASPASYSNLAAIEIQAGEIASAAELLKQALVLSPNSAESWLNLGTVEFALGRYNSAADAFRHAAALKPGFAKAYANLGKCLHAEGDHPGAQAAFQLALEHQPNYPEALSGLGVSMREQGRAQASIPLFQRALALREADPEILNNLALSLQAISQIGSAIHCFEQALNRSPEQPEILSNLGIALMGQGHVGKAAEHFQLAIQLNPHYTEAHRHLGYCIHGSDDPQPEQQALTCLQQLADDPRRYHLQFAIGKYKLDRQDPEAATWFCKANRLRSEQLEGRWQLPKANALLEINQRILNRTNIAPPDTNNSARSGPRLIFIVGLPRCGSTLVETILSRNEQLIDLGEVAFLNQALEGNNTLADIRSSYLEAIQLHPAFKADAQAISDKCLYNFAYCPILAASFPDCRIIHVHRNPMDNLWSTFTNHFASGNEWTYSLEHSVAFYRIYRQVMDANEQLMPGRIYHLNYDHLTRSPELEIPRLIEHCGFQWNDAYLHPEHSGRQIHTASAVQARAPISSRSVGRWRLYQELLGPYADQLEQLGYSTAIEPIA